MADGEGMRLEWHGDEILALLKGSTQQGLLLAAEHLLQVSSNLAPIEEGDLQRSGEVSSDPDEGAVAVSYDRKYAVRQHEDLTYRHDEGRQAKYLEDPMQSEAPTMIKIIHRAAKKGLG